MHFIYPHDHSSEPRHAPGSIEAIYSIHMTLYGNTDRIPVETTPDMDRLEKIRDMLYWNRNKIETQQGYIKKLPMFNTIDKVRRELEFHRQVRLRLFRLWNSELDRLKAW